MNDLSLALQHFAEASQRLKARRAAEQVGRRLEGKLQRAFRRQESLFVQKMREHLRPFFAEGMAGHAAFLTTPLKESVSENDWLAIWIQVTSATAALFSEPIDDAVAKALEIGAVSAIAQVGMQLRFDLKNPRAVRYLDEYGAKLVKGLDETTRDDMRRLISGAVDEGWSWKQLENEISSQFGDYVGDGGRAHLIAMTEMGEAYSEGNFIVGRDLAAAGLTMEKKWDPAGDGCAAICQPNADQDWIPLEQAFQSGHDRPLGHPGCWCDMLMRVAKDS